MKRTFVVALLGVFVVATMVSGFALAFLGAPDAKSAGFVALWFEGALRCGWAAGLGAAAVFAVLFRGRTKREVANKPAERKNEL